MAAIAEVLAVRVAMQGVREVKQQLQEVAQDVDKVRKASTQTLAVITAIGTVGMALIGASVARENLEARFMGVARSVKEINNQIYVFDKLSSKGVFDQPDIANAIKTLSNFKVSLGGNIALVERLGARMGSITQAAEAIGMIRTGNFREALQQLEKVGITRQALTKQGVVFSGDKVASRPQELIAALERIERTDKSLEAMSNTLSAMFRGLLNDVKAIAGIVGQPLVAGLKFVVGHVRAVVEYIRDVNDVTDGWLGKLVLAGGIIWGLREVLRLLKEIEAVEIVLAAIAKIRALWQAGPALISGLVNVLKILFSMRAIEIVLAGIELVRALLAAAYAAAIGNIPGALVALGLIAAAGAAAIGINNAVQNNRNNKEKNLGGSGGDSGARPIRRDDIERVYKHAYGNAWTG